MANNEEAATIDEEAQTHKQPGKSNEELREILAAALEAEVNDINSRLKHSDNINPVIVSGAKDIRRMRRIIVFVAAAVPLVLLGILLIPVYSGLPILINEKAEALKAVEGLAQKADAISALTTPLTALIIGTFASFIIVYSALLVGIFRSTPEERDDKQGQNASSLATQIAQNIPGNGS